MNELPLHKTSIVCTIGPASSSPRVLERMTKAGMRVARLNLAHGDYDTHRQTIAAIRGAAERLGRRVTLLADLPGPKLRVGKLRAEVVELRRGQLVRLVAVGAGDAAADAGSKRDGSAGSVSPASGADGLSGADSLLDIPLSLPALPASLKPGDDIFLNDGLIQLRVQQVATVAASAAPLPDGQPLSALATQGAGGPGPREAGDLAPQEPGSPGPREAIARVVVGGELRYRDGINFPGMDLGISAFTEDDRELLAFAIAEGVEAIGVSFVQGPADITAVRACAQQLGGGPFLIAKIERSQAVERIDAILEQADGVMVARGDLGVDLPIDRIAIVQKLLIGRANALGKPVITATQMLESMTHNRRPTRAEVADVSNAILDGTDCVMLSEETAMGQFPVDAVSVMARIAATAERYREGLRRPAADATSVPEVLAQEAATTAERLRARYIVVPTESGATARSVARLRPEAWIIAFSPHERTCQRLHFSRGVHPVHVPEAARVTLVGSSVDWPFVARRWVRERGLRPGLAVLIQGNNRLEVIDLGD